VIGKFGICTDDADAMTRVAVFWMINDMSEREFQLDRAGTWLRARPVTLSAQ
jgi:2,4-diketo-3-deoxy-L-fuconate hydrolase